MSIFKVSKFSGISPEFDSSLYSITSKMDCYSDMSAGSRGSSTRWLSDPLKYPVNSIREVGVGVVGMVQELAYLESIVFWFGQSRGNVDHQATKKRGLRPSQIIISFRFKKVLLIQRVATRIIKNVLHISILRFTSTYTETPSYKPLSSLPAR